MQVISQFKQRGTHANRYDVSILVNGLPLVQVELKKRGVAIREVFNQVHRYTKESLNGGNSLFNAQIKQKTEALALIAEENLNEEAAKRYITTSLKREYASENGTELNALLPKMSPFKPTVFDQETKCFSKVDLVCREV